MPFKKENSCADSENKYLKCDLKSFKKNRKLVLSLTMNKQSQLKQKTLTAGGPTEYEIYKRLQELLLLKIRKCLSKLV